MTLCSILWFHDTERAHLAARSLPNARQPEKPVPQLATAASGGPSSKLYKQQFPTGGLKPGTRKRISGPIAPRAEYAGSEGAIEVKFAASGPGMNIDAAV